MTRPPSEPKINWHATSYGTPISCQGIWWPAGHRELAEHGTLQGPRDTLYFLAVGLAHHSWPDEDDSEELEPSKDPKISVIHGCTLDGEKITLLKVLDFGRVQRWPGVSLARFASPLLISGYHLANSQELCAAKIAVSLFELEQWFGDRPFRTDDSTEEWNVRFFSGTSFSFKTLFCGGGTLKTNFLRRAREGIELSASFLRQLEFVPDSGGVCVDKAIEFAHGIAEFLTLVSGIPTAIRHVWMIGDGHERGAVFGMPSFPPPHEEDADWYWHRVVFSLADFQSAFASSNDASVVAEESDLFVFNLKKSLSSFMDLKNLHSGSLDLFLALRRKPDYFLELKVVAATQALESYCRAAGYADDIIQEKEYKKLRKELEKYIKNELPEILRQPVSDRLRYANQASLREQIERLLHGMDRLLVERITDQSDAGLAQRITQARNSLVHHRKKSSAEHRDVSFRRLMFILDQIVVILYMRFLVDLGFSSASIAKALSKSKDWKHRLHSALPVSPLSEEAPLMVLDLSKGHLAHQRDVLTSLTGVEDDLDSEKLVQKDSE